MFGKLIKRGVGINRGSSEIGGVENRNTNW